MGERIYIYMCVCVCVCVRGERERERERERESCSKSSKPHPGIREIRHFLINIVPPLDINALGLTMPKHYNPITEESGILIIRKLQHSIYDLTIVSKMANTQVRIEFQKQEDGTKPGE